MIALGNNDPLASRKKLYDDLVKEKLYSQDFESFSVQFSDAQSRKRLYEDLAENGKYSKGFDEFSNQFFADVGAGQQKKSPEAPALSNPESSLADQLQVIPEKEFGPAQGSEGSGNGSGNLSDIIPPVDKHVQALADATKLSPQREALPEEINFKPRQEMQGGFLSGIEEGARQSRHARNTAEIAMAQPKQEVIKHFEGVLARENERQQALQQKGKKDEPIPLLSSQGIGELLGSTAEDITAALIGGLINPIAGVSAGVGLPAYKGYGQGFESAYLQADRKSVV